MDELNSVACLHPCISVIDGSGSGSGSRDTLCICSFPPLLYYLACRSGLPGSFCLGQRDHSFLRHIRALNFSILTYPLPFLQLALYVHLPLIFLA